MDQNHFIVTKLFAKGQKYKTNEMKVKAKKKRRNKTKLIDKKNNNFCHKL